MRRRLLDLLLGRYETDDFQVGDVPAWDGNDFAPTAVSGGSPLDGITILQEPEAGWYVDQLATLDAFVAWRRFNGVTGEIYLYDVAQQTTVLLGSDATVNNADTEAPEFDRWNRDRIAYAGIDHKIHLHDLDGSNPVILAATFDTGPFWLSWRETGIVCSGTIGVDTGVFEVDALTGVATLLVTGPIAWVRTDSDQEGALAYGDSTAWFTADPDGSNPVEITNAVQVDLEQTERAEWDGSLPRLYVVAGGELTAVNADNTSPSTIAPGLIHPRSVRGYPYLYALRRLSSIGVVRESKTNPQGAIPVIAGSLLAEKLLPSYAVEVLGNTGIVFGFQTGPDFYDQVGMIQL